MTLRIGIIGAGQMAGQHVNAIRRLSVPCSIVGVHDLAADRAGALAARAGCTPFASPDALLAEARPDIVHVCTPPDFHFEAALGALQSGAHVYVEKPFARTTGQAQALLGAAQARGLLVCAGHQQLRDPAFEALLDRASDLGTLLQVDSDFAFRPVGLALARSCPSALAGQLVDILPHPLYTLVSLLERCAPRDAIELAWVRGEPGDVRAVLQAGPVTGRLSVSLRARPVAASVTLTGTHGSLACDFVRSMITGTANPGTEVLEKILNPALQGAQLVSRTGASLVNRLRARTDYAGLSELIDAFYRAVNGGGPCPLSPAHLLSVTRLFSQLVDAIDDAVRRKRRHEPGRVVTGSAPLVAVTGAGGFLGAEICRALPRVRGIGRRARPDDQRVEQWTTADLSIGLHPDAVAGAHVVVHAAAETAGGYQAHQRNTIDATRYLLNAMHEAGIRRLVLVSSLSVIRPPLTAWERQDERTPRAGEPRRLGPYTWAKCLQEALIEREASALGIATRIVRPGALIDARDPSLPGLMGRRVFGRWHLGLGRPALPIAVCDVERCAQAIAWCAMHFEEAPPVVNLFDPAIATRGAMLSQLRAIGWNGRVFWVPISVLACALKAARAAAALAGGRPPERLSAWSVLRPRRYDASVSHQLFEAAGRDGGFEPKHEVLLQA